MTSMDRDHSKWSPQRILDTSRQVRRELVEIEAALPRSGRSSNDLALLARRIRLWLLDREELERRESREHSL